MESKEPLEGAETPDQNEQHDASFYHELVEKATGLKSINDWQLGAMEFENIRLKWGEGPEIEDEKKKELYATVLEAQKEFNEARRAYYEKQNERKAANLEKREKFITRMNEIVEQKKWSQFNEVASLQRKFEDVRPLPPEAESQNSRFNALVDEFNKHKVEYLVKIREKEEENLMVKLTILDKVKDLAKGISAETSDWKSLDEQFDSLSDQWKKVGRVVKEKSDEIWEQYKVARDSYLGKKLEFNTEYKAELEKNIKAKETLIAKAEELSNEEDLAIASKEMNILHRRWRETGPVPKAVSEELWTRFKTIFDKFNEVRNENIDEIRAKEQEHYDTKVALCEKAETLVDDDAAVNRKDVIEKLYNEWNAIGPVPKRKTKTIWKRFKNAIDSLQKKRRSFFKEQRQEQKDNLQKKRDIIDKIAAFSEAEDKEAALPTVKELQQEFNEAGFVPIKQKNKVWDDYRAACDLFYKALRSSNQGGSGHSHGGGGSHVPSGARSEVKQKQSEIFRLRKEADKLNEVILQFSDTKTYIKPNKKGLILREEIQEKIDKAQAELDTKNATIESIRQEIETLSNSEDE
ncbi:MAG: DUF349 domain-containing protein [Balneolales bacterium]|nr:DUF349 domain-containing protein [Balneolales bacterium]